MPFRVLLSQPFHFARHSIAALVVGGSVFSANPVIADVGYGAGINYVFGKGLSVGLRLFSDDEQDQVAGSVGVDYMLKGGSWRPVVGVVYLGDDNYGELNIGYNLKLKAFDIGVGVGYANTDDDNNHSCEYAPHPYRGVDFTEFTDSCDGGDAVLGSYPG